MDDIYKSLTLEDCTKVIHTALDDNSVKVLSYIIKPFSDQVEGLMGQHFRVEIKYQNESIKTKNFFVKILNGTLKTILDLCMSVKAYDKEEFFYNTYLKELKKFNIELDCVPQCYLCKPYLIVLEDLSEKGYASARSVDLDVDTCKEALRTLAKLHCSSILYEAYKNEIQGPNFSLISKYPNVLCNVLVSKESNLGTLWFTKSIDGLYKLIEEIPENHIKSKDFTKELSEFTSRLYEIDQNFQSSICTILHGDLWHNNFLFKYQNGKPHDNILFDFQIIKYGPPSLDVLHFLFANTRRSFRDSNVDYLVDYYYECVKNYLAKHKFKDIPTKSKFLLFSKDLRIFIKLLCLCDRTVTLMPTDTMQSTFDNDESLRRYLFEDRSINLVNSYKADSNFREIIQEDLLELRDLMFDNC